jgi:hypothetical protein
VVGLASHEGCRVVPATLPYGTGQGVDADIRLCHGSIRRWRALSSPETIVSGLKFPTGMTVGPDGAFYVSNQGFGFGAGQGQILRIQP